MEGDEALSDNQERSQGKSEGRLSVHRVVYLIGFIVRLKLGTSR